jgi:hypothetical protein
MVDNGDCGAIGGPKFGRRNQSTRRRPAPSATLSTTNPTWPDPSSNPGRRCGKPATNHFSYDTAYLVIFYRKGRIFFVLWLQTNIYMHVHFLEEPGWRSRYRDRLLARRPRGRSSSLGMVENFHYSMSSRPALRFTQPPIQRVPPATSPGVKRPGREADHSPPTSAEVKKMWIYTSTPPYVFMA